MDIENTSYSENLDKLLRNLYMLLHENLTAEQRKLINEILALLFQREENGVVLSRSELNILEGLYLHKWHRR